MSRQVVVWWLPSLIYDACLYLSVLVLVSLSSVITIVPLLHLIDFNQIILKNYDLDLLYMLQ